MTSSPDDLSTTMDKSRKSKFPDFVPPTKIAYAKTGPTATLHLRRCTVAVLGEGGQVESRFTFDKGEITIGAMSDNDVILKDDTSSRYHCKIIQDETGYVVVDLRSTNGTFVNKVRVKEAFLTPGCTLSCGKKDLKFNAKEEKVDIVPSENSKCGDIVGQNAHMRSVYSIIEKIAPTATTVVIEGETGTGKEVVAQSIHKLSTRNDGPIIIFDCGAVPPNLIESELFGHEKGSFTGAVMTRQGLFEMADGGTLFLDELGELPIDLQPKLLRVLEQREVRRVGSSKPIKVDVRIVAATNRNLAEEVKAGNFRQDLFYRLSVVRLTLPALRERKDDIPLLVNHFLQSEKYQRGQGPGKKVTGIAPDALDALQNYNWPGNVRELVNCVERAMSFCESDLIAFGDLPEHIQKSEPPPPEAPARFVTGTGHSLAKEAPKPPPELTAENVTFKDAKEKWVSSFERDYIISLLKRHNGNISHSAREADIDRKYFRKLMKKYAIEAAIGKA